ncbi:PD-(D/E)XK motif protein [Streptococcus bovimastitidis]|uniref:PD-(D/E)XK motif protein n=1 Tax=Streptococcus bovimastitidis TaxID=1856638 RepID=UPI0013F4D5BE|nr:PD-(D/E)XK motif protein [Streptococcus bovimastitidis]
MNNIELNTFKFDTYKLIPSVTAIQVFKGSDILGNLSIAFIFQKEPKLEINTKKISSRIIKAENEFRFFISLNQSDSNSIEIFNLFTNDLTSSIKEADTEKEVQRLLSNRIRYWSDFFKREKNKLKETTILGLIGELWFLNTVLIEKIGVEDSVKSWIGPKGANQDFITKEKIFEIKTHNIQSQTIKISNENQLNENTNLTVIGVEKSSSINQHAYTLSKLVNTINFKISDPETLLIFQRKLLDMDLFPLENLGVYDDSAYSIKKIQYFRISENFPILHQSKIPKAIVKYNYDLLLSGISDFVISEEELWN